MIELVKRRDHLTAMDLVTRVKEALVDVGSKLAKGKYCNADWTYELLNGVGEAGTKLGYSVYPQFDNRERVRGEWLYDLTWCIEDDDVFRGIALALESEWSSTPWMLTWDFQKIVQAKALVKVFVCETLKDKTKEMLLSNIKNFEEKSSVERYLLAMCSSDVEDAFEFEVYDGDGNRIGE